jgi:hypothetical protein
LSSFCCAAHAVTYVKLADEWGTIQTAGPRTGINSIRAWNIQGGSNPAFASAGTLRFYMTDLASQLNTAFPAGWQVNKATIVLEHDDAGFSLAGGLNVFHFTDDALAITSAATSPTDAPPNDFSTLGISPLRYLDTGTDDGQPVRVSLDGGAPADLGTVTKVGSLAFSPQGDQNLDVIANSGSIVDPAAAIDAAPAYSNDFPDANVDDTLATFTTEQTTDESDLAGAATIISDIQSGTDALSFIFAATEDNSTVAATYKGNPFGLMFQPRIYLDVTAAGPPVGVSGDYNNNGVVDAADYVIWRNGGPLQNEVSGVTPGTVTPEDYDAWRARFGNITGSGSNLSGGAVPEPASAVLLLVGVATLGWRRRTA